MYTLYTCPGTCSSALHVILKECGVAYETKIVNLRAGDTQTPEYLAMNPRGQVPVLVIDGKPVVEGGGLITYLLEAHPNDLMPPIGSVDRAIALQWLAFANATLHPTHWGLFFPHRFAETPEAQAQVAKMAAQRVQGLWNDVEAALTASGATYIAGAKCTAADVLLSVIAGWTRGRDPEIALGPKTQAMIAATVARPSFQAVSAAEGFKHFAMAA